MSIFSKFSAFFLLAVSTFAMGQRTTQEDLGVVTAAQMSNGLGWNVTGYETEFAAAAAAGATHVRLASCAWGSIEGQSAPPNNVSTGYSLTPSCISSLNLSKKYGLHPTVVAAFGAPYHQILTLTLPSGAAAGATSLSVEYTSGVGGKTLSSITYPYDYIADSDGTILSTRRSYPGTFIAGISLTGEKTATIKLSAALLNALAPGTTLYVNEILYPSPLVASPTDPSVQAFANYAQYLAKQINAYGLTGEVELWNEPPWYGDCWDNRRNCYDTDPGLPNELGAGITNFGFAAALQLTTPIPGVTYIWAGSNKTSSQGLLTPNMLKYSGASFIEPQTVVTAESLHPYGNNPEDNAWNQPCIVANPKLGQHCNTFVGSNGNMVNGEALTLIARQTNPAYGLKHVITETGSSTLNGDLEHLARFTMRQYLTYMADDISFIELYRLYQPSDSGQTLFSYITLTNNNTTFTPLPAYTAFAGLMSDLAPMNLNPVTSYSSTSLPSVSAYSGTYNLDHLSIVGARPGDNANSIMYVLWQRSNWQDFGAATICQPYYTQPCWGTVTQPVAASTTVTIPSGLKVAQAMNLVTRGLVQYSQDGASVTLGVSDDPIELLFVPTGDTVATSITPKLIFGAVPDQIQGNSVVVSATSSSKGSVTYSVTSGSATVLGNKVTVTGPGTVVLKASQAANGNYTAATATTSFNVTATTPVIGWTQVTPRTYGDAVVVHAGSNSPAPITYSIASGPATITGTSVTLTGIGTVVVEASQPSSGAFTPASASMSFTVAAKKPVLSFGLVSQTVGVPLTLNATSTSNAPITYSVVSGPATISGSTANFTATGQVTIQASQPAFGGYTAVTAQASCYVGVGTATITLPTIPTTPYQSSIVLKAITTSSAPVNYTIVSGPARITGSTVTTLSTPGTVVVKASQNSNNVYGPASTTASFTVAETVAPALTFAAISSKAPGDVFNVSASSPSSGAITYSVVSGPATIAGSTVTVTGAGTVVLKASQAASGNYSAATATTTATVTAATASLTFANIPSKTAGDVFNVSASSPSSGAITYSVVSGPATVAGSTVTVTGAGTVVLKASQAATSTYSASTATTTFSVATATSTLAFANIPSKTVGDVFNVSATSSSTGAVSYSVVSGPATVSGSTVTATGAGTVVLKASQAATSTYSASTATTTFSVVTATPTLAFANVPAKTAGDTFTVSATSASTGAVSYSIISGPATISGSTVTTTGAGTVVVKATQAATSTYNGTSATFSVVVGTKTPTLTLANISAKTTGDVFTVSATSASSGAVTYSVISGPATIAGSTITATGPGTVVVQASQAASGIYGTATTTSTFTVLAPPALTFADISPKNSGDIFTLSATSPSTGAITYSVLSGPAVILSGSTCEVTGAGTVVIRAVQAASGVYKSLTAQTTFSTTGGQPKALTFQPITPKVYGDSFKVAATSASPGAITYSVLSGQATLSGSKLTVAATSPGTVTLQASQVAAGSYPAATTTITFTVTTIGPVVTFANIPPQSVGNVFVAKATSPSPGAIGYKIVSGPAKMTGSTVSVTGTGTIVLRADQQASGGYGEAHAMVNVEVQ